MAQTITKAVIPAAGLGTRLLTATKELPKEMLSVFSPGPRDEITLKPVVQLIFEQLYDSGIREFCFVVGRGKRAIEDHFTPDEEFVRLLEQRGKKTQAVAMRGFYSKVQRSSVIWANQPQPRGFGDAVLCAKSFSVDGPFLVQAGDNYVISSNNNHIKRLIRLNDSSAAKATLMLRHVRDPRQYGVAELKREKGGLAVSRVVEKPARPASKLALLPTYIFQPEIFDLLGETQPGMGDEIQLTDAIQGMIEKGMKVNAVKLHAGEFWLDVGTPETYWQALNVSHKMFSERR